MSKIGVHIVSGPRNGYGEFLRRCGDHLTVVKAVDEAGALWEARQFSDVLTVMAWESLRSGVNPQDDPVVQARAWWGRFLIKYNLLSTAERLSIDVYETNNENNGNWSFWADFSITVMDKASEIGLHLCILNYSTGTPPLQSDKDSLLALSEIARACRVARDGGHYLGLHQYGGVPPQGIPYEDWPKTLKGTGPLHALRHRDLAGYLKSVNALPRIIITECGQDGGYTFLGTQTMMDDVAWYDQELFKDEYIVGATWWTLGNWNQANYQDALPVMADYIISHPTPEPIPEPPMQEYDRTMVLFHPSQYRTEWVTPVTSASWWTNRLWTMGQSAHDAVITASDAVLKSRTVIAINPSLWGVNPTLKEWFDANFTAGFAYIPVTSGSPSGLVKAIEEALGMTPPPPPPPSVWAGIVSVHGRADGGRLRTIDKTSVTAARLTGFKFYKNARDDYADLASAGIPMANCLVRLEHVKDRRATVDFYINEVTTGIWELPIREAYASGVRWFEPFNEVNLGVEGLGVAWTSPEDFYALYLGCVVRMMIKFPDIKVLSPSIGPGQPNTRQWIDEFERLGIFEMADGIAAHSYWDSRANMDVVSQGRSYRDYLPHGKRIHITEASNNKGFDTDDEKGRQYVDYMKSLETQVARVDFFVLSSSNVGDGLLFNQRRETWVRVGPLTDTISAIPFIVGAR